jgi:transposase
LLNGLDHKRAETDDFAKTITHTDRVEIITSVQRRRRWTAAEKVRMVEETFEPGMTVSLVARRHGVAPNQLFTWRRLVVEGALTAAGSGEQVVPASDYRALQSQVRELQRLLGKKTLEAEILKEALEHATGSKKQLRLPPSRPKDGSR